MKLALRFSMVFAILVGALVFHVASGYKVDAAGKLKGTVWTNVSCIGQEECPFYEFDTETHYSYLDEDLGFAEDGKYQEVGNTVRMYDDTPPSPKMYHEGTINGQEMSVRLYESEGKLWADAVSVYKRTK